MTYKIAIHLGEDLPPNLIRLFDALEEITEDDFKFSIVGTGVDPSGLPDSFEYHNITNMSSDRGLTRIVSTYRRMIAYLKDVNEIPDAIWQITTPQFHALPVIAAARLYGIPVATRIPGNKFNEYQEQSSISAGAKTYLLNNLALRALKYSTLVVTLSKNNKENLLKLGIPASKIRIIRPPLDTDQFAPVGQDERAKIQSELGFNRNAYTPLYVGRLSKLKGMADMEEVLARFEGNEDYEFHFVGSGEFKSKLADHSNSVVHGFVDPEEIHRYYKAADLYVHPSYTEEEGISWTMLEAAATGLPVITRDIGNAADISSYVFTDTSDLVSCLSSPEKWTRATYPTEWSLNHLRPAYNNFLNELV